MCCWQWKLILGCSQVVRLWLNETLKPVNLYYLSNQAACQTFQSHLHVLVMQCEGKVIVAWEHFVTVKFCKVSNNIWVDFHRLLNIKAMAKKKPNQITSCICITHLSKTQILDSFINYQPRCSYHVHITYFINPFLKLYISNTTVFGML